MATVAAHLTVEDLEARYRGASHTIEKSHFQAVWLLAKGRGIGEVAEVTAFTPRWLCKLIDRYNRHGPDALGDRRAGNGPPGRLLTEPVLAALRERLTTPPRDGGLWSGGSVAAWLA